MSNKEVREIVFDLLRDNPNVEDIQALIDKYPDALKEKNKNGHLPLHEAVYHGASVKVIQLLIKEYPQAVREKDRDGDLPLHYAVWRGSSVEVVELLIKEYSDALKEKNHRGNLPLHYSAFPNVEKVQALIDKYPDALKEKNENGYLPLHEAVYHGASVEVLKVLIEAYPQAVREKDRDGDLPLHYAVWRGASVEVVELLIKEYSDAVKEKNHLGNLPLHYSALYGGPVAVAQRLIIEYPKALKMKGSRKKLPLHFAAEKGASVEVIQLLIKEYPDAVKVKEKDGKLPLHWAVYAGASVEVLQLLIKAYPDAAKKKDGDGNLLLSRPQIKEIYNRVVTVVQNLTRSKGLLGDHDKGRDLLGVSEEAQAIADTIAFKDLDTPFVVGIIGGWGSGKSFTFNLIQEHLKKIQEVDLTNEVVKLGFPYVGHTYLIKFDVWTFAKGCLWAGLMHCILTELNDQLDLEAAIGPELLKEGVSVIELMDQFTTIGEIKYMTEAMKGERLKEAIREWKPRGGNITKALIDATNSSYKEEVKELAEKRQQLDHLTSEFEKQKDKKKLILAWEDVTAGKSTKILPEINKLLKDAYTQYAEENPGDTVPQTVEAVMNNLERWKGLIGQFWRWWDLLWAGRLSPLWFVVFLFSLILAVVLPPLLDKVGAIATAIGPLVSAIVFKFNDARAKLTSAQDVIIEIASEINLDKEQLQEAMEAANKAQLRSDTNDEEKQQDIIKVLNAEINSLEDRIWLKEGDSLNKVVADRVGSNNYEEHLGVVHQAQADLKRISDAMLSSKRKENFPRGDPRIVLFIDDLDRCPPKKVVETLEAVQLLVKTKLFVVVLAIDAQYVTLCLEKEYEDILRQERHPSGLDYVEKIVQLPYRVPPISVEYVKSYLQAQMNAKMKETHKSSHPEEVSGEPKRSRSNEDTRSPAHVPLLPDNADKATRDEETPMTETAQSQSEPEVPSPEAEDSKGDDGAQSLSDNATAKVTRDEETPMTGAAQSPPEEPEDPKRDDDTQAPADSAADKDISDDDSETPMIETTQSEEEAVPLPTQELDFTWEELELLEDACVISGVGPRSGRRLVNVFKLMKIIWYRRDQTPGVDTPHEVRMKEACVFILALCASNSKSVRQEMCKVLAKIEKRASRPADCDNLKDFIKKALGEIGLEQVDDSPLTMIYDEKCNRVFEKVMWKDDKEWNLVKNDLRLLRSFSFVGEYNEPLRRSLT